MPSFRILFIRSACTITIMWEPNRYSFLHRIRFILQLLKFRFKWKESFLYCNIIWCTNFLLEWFFLEEIFCFHIIIHFLEILRFFFLYTWPWEPVVLCRWEYDKMYIMLSDCSHDIFFLKEIYCPCWDCILTGWTYIELIV
jgi:hypothetical protein